MAWTATFLADFQQWDAALRQAETKLGSFEQSTAKTKNSLQKMVSEFDGTKVIQQAGTMAEAVTRAGGAAKLTDAELKRVNATLQEALEKYRRMGQDAPTSLRSMADAVSAQLRPLEEVGKKTSAWGSAFGSVKSIAAGFVAGFTLDRVLTGIGSAVTSTIAWSGSISDMASKTDVSTRALQRWEFAGNRAGNTLDHLTDASVELSKRLGEGKESTVAALDRVGLSYSQLRLLSPEEQFETVADALKGVKDQSEAVALGAALMGDKFKIVAPTIRAGLKDAGDEAERLGLVVKQETIDGLDKLGDVWGDITLAGRSLIADALSPMVRVIGDLNNAFDELATKQLPGRRAVSGAGLLDPAGATASALNWNSSAWGLTISDPSRTPQQNLGLVSAGFSYQEWLQKEAEAHRKAERRTQDLVRAQEAYIAALAAYMERIAVPDRIMAIAGQRAFSVGGPDIRRGTIVSQDPSNPFGGLLMLPPAGGGGNYSALMRPGLAWGDASRAGLNAAMPWLSQLVAGGSRGGQIGGSIGGTIGGIGSSLMSGMTGALGTLGTFLGPIGGIVGGLLGRLFGPSRGAILGKEADARIGQTQAGLLQQWGSLEAIAATGSAGADLAAAWGSKNVQGEAHFNALVRAFERQNSLLGEQKGLQAEIAGIEAQRKGIQDGLKTTWEQVVAITEKYGISLEGLGGTVRQLGATTTWAQMLNDIQALERAGGDVGGILAGMQDEISALVRESRRLGLEMPENMRPYVEELLRAGRLTDENGEALVDLAGLRWGPAVQTQADIARQAMEKLDEALTRLTDRLAEIVDLLANKLPEAANQGARGAGGAVSGIEPGIRIEESFRGGSGGVRDFGAGTLAMLHGREIVQTEAQYRASASGVITASQVVLDRRVIGEIIFELLPTVAARRGLVPGMAY